MSDLLIALLRAEKPQAVFGSHNTAGDATILVAREHLVEVMQFLRDDPRCRMEQLIDVTVADYLEYAPELRAQVSPCDADNRFGFTSARLPRFEVVYHLLSLSLHHRLRVKTFAPEDDAVVPSMCDLWIAANWGEREAWDMLGVRFEGHPDLRRILTYPEFKGHPVRKDYPLRGYQPLIPMPELGHYTDQENFR
ncbi:MAG: NADH-quinone oxidoreductase subunit C [Myxococcota bacterium]